MNPNNPVRWTVAPAALRLLPIGLLLTLAPFGAAAADAQTLRETGPSQPKTCMAQAQEWLKECEAEEKEAKEEAENRDGPRDRGGLGWTGIALISAGSGLVVSAATVDRWRSCGPLYRRTCQSIERRHGISGGVMLTLGLTFLIVDEDRRHQKPSSARRQTAIAIGPRAVEVRMSF